MITRGKETQRPHRRYNPLTGEWILVSPHRVQRPWLGEEHKPKEETPPSYDKQCYLCPGNRRAGQATNPVYEGVYAFTNDFAALLPQASTPRRMESDALLREQFITGTCRVLCYSPRHDLTLADMSPAAVTEVVRAWAEQTAELSEMYDYVQIFENKGDLVGCSNPHPHGQIWACNYIPSEVVKERTHQDAYHTKYGSCLLSDYLLREEQEAKRGIDRFVLNSTHWVVLVPFWAYWPFETLVLPRRALDSLILLNDDERADLANIIIQLCAKYDKLFGTSFPYIMGWHGEGRQAGQFNHRLLHAHFYPPLLRSATVRKHRAGFEMLAESQRDITPEEAAARLREC